MVFLSQFVAHACAAVIWAAVADAGSPLSARDVIWKFSKGNAKYVRQTATEGLNFKRKFNAQVFNTMREDPLKPIKRQAIVISDSRSYAATDEIFGCTEPGELQTIRVSGCVCRPNDQFDGVIGSLEYALMQPQRPPLLLLIANTQNEVVEDAVRLATSKSSDDSWVVDSGIVQAILPAAKDAIMQYPHASFGELCDTAAKLSLWNSIEAMLTSSPIIYDAVKSGAVELHGAFLDSKTGEVQFMGEHPAKEALLAQRPVHVRTAQDPTVPPEEAIAMLVAGNKRYVKGNSLQTKFVGGKRNKRLTESGQSPIAIIMGCADSRAPPDILFDARPGNLFVLRTAGNTLSSGPTSILGSAEYGVGHLRSKLIVVMGHTRCGAVTAAVEAVMAEQDLDAVPGSIGQVLADLHSDATEAVKELGSSSTAEKVVRACGLNVLSTMEKIIKSSPLIAEGIRNMDVQVHGAVYDIESGEVQFLGQHPNLADMVKDPMPVHAWKHAPYVRANGDPLPVDSTEIELLRNGNIRFTSGKTIPSGKTTTVAAVAENPYALVLAGSEIRVPIENIFDTGRGEILVQRCMGTIMGHSKNGLLESLDYSVKRFSPKLLLVLGTSGSSVIDSALKHIDGERTSFGPTHIVHEAVCASALEATLQTSPGGKSKRISTLAGREKKLRGLTVELNALYTVEQLFRHSKIVRDAVKEHKLEVQLGILHEDTGKVEFIGKHPLQDELIKDEANSEADSQSLDEAELKLDVLYTALSSSMSRVSALMLFLLYQVADDFLQMKAFLRSCTVFLLYCMEAIPWMSFLPPLRAVLQPCMLLLQHLVDSKLWIGFLPQLKAFLLSCMLFLRFLFDLIAPHVKALLRS